MSRSDELDRLVSMITVDCYGLAEEATAFYEVFREHVSLPLGAAVVGVPVDIISLDFAAEGFLMARCRRGESVQDIAFSDIVFAPDTTAAWIHAAYRRCLGLKPYSADIPEDWELIFG